MNYLSYYFRSTSYFSPSSIGFVPRLVLKQKLRHTHYIFFLLGDDDGNWKRNDRRIVVNKEVSVTYLLFHLLSEQSFH